MSDLIVIGYPDEARAQNVWQDLVKLQHDYLVDLEDAAIIRRDQKGKLHITARAHPAVAWGPSPACSGTSWSAWLFLFSFTPLVSAAGGILGAALGSAGKDEFRQRVQDLVQAGTSAVLVIVRKGDH